MSSQRQRRTSAVAMWPKPCVPGCTAAAASALISACAHAARSSAAASSSLSVAAPAEASTCHNECPQDCCLYYFIHRQQVHVLKLVTARPYTPVNCATTSEGGTVVKSCIQGSLEGHLQLLSAIFSSTLHVRTVGCQRGSLKCCGQSLHQLRLIRHTCKSQQ